MITILEPLSQSTKQFRPNENPEQFSNHFQHTWFEFYFFSFLLLLFNHFVPSENSLNTLLLFCHFWVRPNKIKTKKKKKKEKKIGVRIVFRIRRMFSVVFDALNENRYRPKTIKWITLSILLLLLFWCLSSLSHSRKKKESNACARAPKKKKK